MKTENMEIIRNMKVSVDREAVFRMIDCREDSPVYGEMLEVYEELLPAALELAEGRCIFGTGEIAGEDAAGAARRGRGCCM